jgi:hypothetical protein
MTAAGEGGDEDGPSIIPPILRGCHPDSVEVLSSESQAHPSVRQQGTHPIDHSPVKPQAETPLLPTATASTYLLWLGRSFLSSSEQGPRPGHQHDPSLHEHHFTSSDEQKAHFTDIRHRTEESGRTGAKSILGLWNLPPLAIESSPDFHYAYPVLPHESFSESRPPYGATECGLFEERAVNDEIVSSHETIINR